MQARPLVILASLCPLLAQRRIFHVLALHRAFSSSSSYVGVSLVSSDATTASCLALSCNFCSLRFLTKLSLSNAVGLSIAVQWPMNSRGPVSAFAYRGVNIEFNIKFTCFNTFSTCLSKSSRGTSTMSCAFGCIVMANFFPNQHASSGDNIAQIDLHFHKLSSSFFFNKAPQGSFEFMSLCG